MQTPAFSRIVKGNYMHMMADGWGGQIKNVRVAANCSRINANTGEFLIENTRVTQE